MLKNSNNFSPGVDFKGQTPKMLIGREKQNPLYEKAFLSHSTESKTEFALNTTTWD